MYCLWSSGTEQGQHAGTTPRTRDLCPATFFRRKLKRHPLGVQPWSPPLKCQKSLPRARARPQASTGERERARAEGSQHMQSRCTVLLCVSLLFFTHSHLPLLHSVVEYVHEDPTSVHCIWNLRNLINWCQAQTFYPSRNFWLKHNAIVGDLCALCTSAYADPPP